MDPRLQRFTDADCLLLGIFGDTVYQNNGTHLNGRISIAKDAKWQRLYTCITSFSLQLYDLPNGSWAYQFLDRLTNLWVGVIQCHWN